MSQKAIFLALLLLFTTVSLNAADWRYGSVRASDNKQVDIDYQSIRQESGYIIFEVRFPPEKSLANLFSSAKYYRESYAVECDSKKVKWLSSSVENKDGDLEIKFSRGLVDADINDIPPGSMIAGVQEKLCREMSTAATPSNTTALKPQAKSTSTMAPNGIVADEWIHITQVSGVTYYAKKKSLERHGDIVSFITGQDLGTDKTSSTGKTYRFEIELSTIDCRNNTYLSGDSERFDSAGAYTETIVATKLQSSPHPIRSDLGVKYKKLMCRVEVGGDSSAQANNGDSSSNENSFATGTAWQLTKIHLVTAYHVVQGATGISVLIDDDNVRSASLVTYDEKNDLAILKIDGTPLQTTSINLANGPARIGSNIAVLGFPLPELLGTKLQANSGEVSAIHGLRNDPRFYRITANVQGGNSGGPVLNQYGEVIGIVSSKLSDLETLKSKGELPQNVNFAVKNHYLRALMESAHIKPQRAQRKLKPIEDVIEDMRGSVFLVVTETKGQVK